MAIPLKNLLGDAVNRAGITKGVLASNVVKEFHSVCRELYGVKTCEMIEHVSYRNKTLAIKCKEAVVAQNLRFNKMRLINEVNGALKAKAVKDIQISIV